MKESRIFEIRFSGHFQPFGMNNGYCALNKFLESKKDFTVIIQELTILAKNR